MRIQAIDNMLVIKEAFSGLILETAEGNRIGLCMKDDTFEINISPKGKKEHKWYRVNMQLRTIRLL